MVIGNVPKMCAGGTGKWWWTRAKLRVADFSGNTLQIRKQAEVGVVEQ